MGTEGTQTVVVNSVGREIFELGEAASRAKGAAVQLTIDADVQKAIEDGVRRLRLQRRGGGAGSAQRRGPRVHEPARVRPQRVRRRNRPRDVGGAQHRRSAAAPGPRAPGPVLARIDVQDGGRPRRARGRHHHAGLQGVLPRRRELLRPLFQVLEARAATARSTCGTPSSSRATCTSTRSRTCSASTGSTSGRRCSASA